MQTQHYGFKLFEAAEKPTWLTDWNNTMNKIDSTIARLSGGGGDTPDLAELTQRVQALEGRVDSDELRLNVVEGDIVDMLQTLSDVQTALSQAQSDIVANKSSSDTQISNLNNNINTINTSLGSMSSSITSLSDRVTALENAPSYSLPTASASTLGGVKVGSGLSINDNGVLSATGDSGGLTLLISKNEAYSITLSNYSVNPAQYKAFLVFCIRPNDNIVAPSWVVPSTSLSSQQTQSCHRATVGTSQGLSMNVEYTSGQVGAYISSFTAIYSSQQALSNWRIYGIK